VFVTTRERHLDHNHETGAFRAIVCQKCNCCDSYIKYPNGYSKKEWDHNYYFENKSELNTKQSEKIKCICGAILSRSNIARHKNSKNHLKNMDKYMNNID
tara:strand:+ start:274 stop:573 length:300 start_codon:yes stop_codon:yes gene_type:complete